MYPHVIRLRGPWSVRPAEATSGETTTVPTPPGAFVNLETSGPVRLRRAFHWTAKLAPDERVSLRIGHAVGQLNAILNGMPLGSHTIPWTTFEYDVTDEIRPSNELVLELAELANRWQAEWDTCRALRHGVPRIGTVELVVESRDGELTRFALEPNRQGAAAWLQLGGECVVGTPGSPSTLDLVFALDGRPLDSLVLTGESTRQAWERTFVIHDVEPWQPRRVGLPSTRQFSVACYRGSTLLWERRADLGWRTLEPIDGNTASGHGLCWRVNGRVIEPVVREVDWSTSLSPTWGEPADRPIDRWRWSEADVLHVCGHLPPASFYRIADRAGFLVVQNLPFDDATFSEVAEARDELVKAITAVRHHACLAAWCLPSRTAVGNVGPLLAQLDPSRAVFQGVDPWLVCGSMGPGGGVD